MKGWSIVERISRSTERMIQISHSVYQLTFDALVLVSHEQEFLRDHLHGIDLFCILVHHKVHCSESSFPNDFLNLEVILSYRVYNSLELS